MNDWLNDAIEKIRKFEDLEENWNSYGAVRIHPVAIDTAIAWLTALSANVPRPHIVPTSSGHVGLEWGTGYRTVELDIRDDGKVNILLGAEMVSPAEATIRTIEWLLPHDP